MSCGLCTDCKRVTGSPSLLDPARQQPVYGRATAPDGNRAAQSRREHQQASTAHGRGLPVFGGYVGTSPDGDAQHDRFGPGGVHLLDVLGRAPLAG